MDADPPIYETAPSTDDVKEAVAKLKGGVAAGICNINAELLKAGGGAMMRGLHAVLTSLLYDIQVPFLLTEKKRGWSSLSGRGKGTVRTGTTTAV